MKLCKPSYRIVHDLPIDYLYFLERIGRISHKSEDRITENSAERFVKSLISMGHESVLEHLSISVLFICDRAVGNELVRHRLGAYTQESTRYCNYSQGKFDREITVIIPPFFDRGTPKFQIWYDACEYAERQYFRLLDLGAKPEEARDVLPLSLKTEIISTFNLRMWRHVLRERTAKEAHPQMRELMIPLAMQLSSDYPLIFGDILV